ncbi:hypothetical protein EXN61_18420 [Agrobacterium tumefaciens]|uniref:Uncharacterized protein n=1 Tax=Agrobacterium tumefaciens TaxID=358 RepID=A0A546XW97_AGRTU|nr:hypothetical protein EXN61_18420 [Agrobacterium tumefaciens]
MGRKFNVLSANRLHLLAVPAHHHERDHAHHTWQRPPTKAIGLARKVAAGQFAGEFSIQIQRLDGPKRIRRKWNRFGCGTVCERIEYESLTRPDSAFVLRNIWLENSRPIQDCESG